MFSHIDSLERNYNNRLLTSDVKSIFHN